MLRGRDHFCFPSHFEIPPCLLAKPSRNHHLARVSGRWRITVPKMASLVDNYEQQYAVLTADITAKIGRIRIQSGGK